LDDQDVFNLLSCISFHPVYPGSDFILNQKEGHRRKKLACYINEMPTRKLDYIFYNHDKITCIKSWVLEGIDSSDHLPSLMTFAFRG
jgi:hypothetical protein